MADSDFRPPKRLEEENRKLKSLVARVSLSSSTSISVDNWR
jgi:hypothetical protein